jgi:hypothetical protein
MREICTSGSVGARADPGYPTPGPIRFAGAAARTALTSYGPRVSATIGARSHRPRGTLDHVDR